MTGTTEDLQALRTIVSIELQEPLEPSIVWLAEKVAATHGETVLGVLFYGSRLHQEGVLDFWVVVDNYRDAYSDRLHPLINRIAAPNVFYLELEYQGTTLRTKYGVIDRATFEDGTSLNAWHSYVWARFSQPARLVAARDDEATQFLIACVANAITTMVGRLVCLLPTRGTLLRFSLAAFWQEGFRRTYNSERRPESDDEVDNLYQEDPERYNAVATLALQHLARIGRLEAATPHPRSFSISVSLHKQRNARLRWQLMRAFSRVLGLVRLTKTAFKFGDWVPYGLWKLERQTGRHIEFSERQRNHPLIFAWPVILQLLLKRNLR